MVVIRVTSCGIRALPLTRKIGRGSTGFIHFARFSSSGFRLCVRLKGSVLSSRGPCGGSWQSREIPDGLLRLPRDGRLAMTNWDTPRLKRPPEPRHGQLDHPVRLGRARLEHIEDMIRSPEQRPLGRAAGRYLQELRVTLRQEVAGTANREESPRILRQRPVEIDPAEALIKFALGRDSLPSRHLFGRHALRQGPPGRLRSEE